MTRRFYKHQAILIPNTILSIYEHLNTCPGLKIVVFVIRFNLQSVLTDTPLRTAILERESPLRTL